MTMPKAIKGYVRAFVPPGFFFAGPQALPATAMAAVGAII